ncbi:MAG: response regulator [Calditrichia bacterium]|nr:response regulator [Calditrichia bacterium]
MQRLKNKKQKILLFDNDNELANNIKLYLEDIYSVRIVISTEGLISEINNNSYDFLIFEVNSFDTHFNKIINKIRLIVPNTKIILMCTFFDTDINTERFILSKVDDYIFKPFNVNLLKQKLTILLTSKKVVSLS